MLTRTSAFFASAMIIAALFTPLQASATTSTVAASSSSGGVQSFADGITRLAGITRYDTALEISGRYQSGVPALFLATGTDFPDALSAAAAAASVGGPLLLTTPTALPRAVRAEIIRLAPARIYVVGGEGAVSRNVLNAVKSIAPTQRIGGASRYDTARMIVTKFFAANETVFLATGRTFPDALAATGAAGSLRAPVVLVDGAAASVPPATLSTIRSLGARSVVIAGETGAVSAKIATQLTNSGLSVNRQGGASRYDTAASINDAFFARGTSSTAFLTTGANFPDALAGAALAGSLGSPIYITPPLCVPSSIHTSIARFGAPATVVLGGAAVVSENAAKNLGCLVSPRPTISGLVQVGKRLTAHAGAWTAGTTLLYQWFANGRGIPGATSSTIILAETQFGTKVSVRVTGSQPGYLSASSTSISLVPVTRPTRTGPINSTTCPSWAPIKGNASSMIYHVPWGAFYSRTTPEECFSTEAAARAAGYRKSKV